MWSPQWCGALHDILSMGGVWDLICLQEALKNVDESAFQLPTGILVAGTQGATRGSVMIMPNYNISPFVSRACFGRTFIAIALELTPRVIAVSWHAPTNHGGEDHEIHESMDE